MQETNTNIRIPNEEDPSDVIRIEGDPAGVKKVKAELMEMAKKMVCACYCVYLCCVFEDTFACLMQKVSMVL